jgi:hypothetical protein
MWRGVLIWFVAACGRLGFDAREASDVDAGAPGSARMTYTASIAECIDPIQPTATKCTTNNGAEQLVVDGNDGMTNHPWQAYLRFDLDDALDGQTIAGVTLQLTATDNPKANGPDSGDIWHVAAFDPSSLASGAPAKVGGSPLAESRGSVDPLDVVEWRLPPSTVIPGAPVYLGVITTAKTGGVNYWNRAGVDPPRLIVSVF